MCEILKRNKLAVKTFLILIFTAIASFFYWTYHKEEVTSISKLVLLCTFHLLLLSLLGIINIKLGAKFKVSKEKKWRAIFVLAMGTTLSFLFSWMFFALVSLFGIASSLFQQGPLVMVLLAFFYCIFFLTDIFYEALNKVHGIQSKEFEIEQSADEQFEKSKKRAEIVIKTKKDLIKLPITNIALIRTKGGIVVIYDMEGKGHLCQYSSINEIDGISEISFLFRVNRQYLVNHKIIASFQDDINGKLNITLKDCFNEFAPHLQISRYKNKDFKSWYDSIASKSHSA